MKLLEAVNLVLRDGGKPAVNSLSDPNEDKGFAMAEITRQRKQILTNGYIFNTTYELLQPDGGDDSRVPVPVQGVLNITYPQSKRYTAMTGPAPNETMSVFDVGDGRSVGEFVMSEVQAIVVRDIFRSDDEGQWFDRLPEKCALWIAKRSSEQFFFQQNQGSSDSLRAMAEKAKTLFINSLPKRNINLTTGFWALRSVNSGGAGNFDARTQTNVF